LEFLPPEYVIMSFIIYWFVGGMGTDDEATPTKASSTNYEENV
jgi:hypothetical protein